MCPTTDSIFAVLPEGVSAEDATSDFRTACRQCSGTPFPPYLDYLTQFTKAELEDKVRPIIKEFLAHVKTDITDGVTRHLALLFATLYLGARMADEAEVWPWDKAKLLQAMAYCFRVAKSEIRPPDPLPGALEVLRSRLQNPKVVECHPGATSLGASRAPRTFSSEPDRRSRTRCTRRSSKSGWAASCSRTWSCEISVLAICFGPAEQRADRS